LVNENSHPDR